MSSISPQMLGLAGGKATIMTTPGGGAPDGATALKRLLRVALRWRLILIGSLVAGAVVGLLVTLLTTRQYASTVRLQIARETAQVVNLGNVSRDVSIGDQEFYQTQYGLLRAQALAERVARDLRAVDDPAFFRMFGRTDAFATYPGAAGRAKRNEIAGQILLGRVEISPMLGSSLVDVRALTPSPELSQKIARTWGQDFIASNLERRMAASGYASQFLEARLAQLRDKLEVSERRAMEYAAAQGIVDLPSTANGSKPSAGDATQTRSLMTDDLVALNAALEKATAERIEASGRLAAGQTQPDASKDALKYRAIGLVRAERAKAAADYARLTAQGSADDPAAKAAHAQVVALDVSIASEESRLRAALQQAYQAALDHERGLTQRVDALKTSLADLRKRSIQYNIYQRDADTNRELYDGLLQRYKEVGVAGAAQNNNVAVIDAAKLPDQPFSPRLSIDLVLFILAGAIVGAVAVAVLEQIDTGLAEPVEFEEKLGLPLLGTAPKLKTEAPLEALKNPRSALVEAYLDMGANLELRTAHGAPRSLAVVSTRSGEGRSTTAIALARTLARARRKVALVDADLRSPSLHRAFGLKNASGLSDLLAGDADIGAALHPTDQEDLSVITAGSPQPNPADLLIGDRLARLVKALQEQFDHVIFDGPQVTGFADAPLVASAVQGVVYVVRARAAPAGAVRTALGRFKAAQLAGGVLTMAEPGRAGLG